VDYVLLYHPDESIQGRVEYKYDEEEPNPTYRLLETRNYNPYGSLISLSVYKELDGVDVVKSITKYFADYTVESVSTYWYDEDPSSTTQYALTTIEVWDSSNKATRNLKSHIQYYGEEGDERMDYIVSEINFNTGVDTAEERKFEYLVDFTSERISRYEYDDPLLYAVPSDIPLRIVHENEFDDSGAEVPIREIHYRGPRDHERIYEIIDLESDGSPASRQEFYYGDDFLRSDDPNMGAFDPLRRIDTHIYFTDGTTSYLATETYFSGPLGEERIDVVKKFDIDGVTVKNISKHHYDFFGAL
jgi:hypothetical protein